MVGRDEKKLEIVQLVRGAIKSIAPQKFNLEFCLEAQWVHVMECGHMCCYDAPKCCNCEYLLRDRAYRDICNICQHVSVR